MKELDDIFANDFLKAFEEKKEKEILISQEEKTIVLNKYNKIQPIKEFLQKFVDANVYVSHKDNFDSVMLLQKPEPQKFFFYEKDSSASWAPGVSLCFDHPAEVEIAVPNDPAEGIVVIHAASKHPFNYLLQKQFIDIVSACHALAGFISRNTVSVGKIEGSKQSSQSILDRVPEEPDNNK